MKLELQRLRPQVDAAQTRSAELLAQARGLVDASKVARLERRMPDADAWTKELTAWILTRRGLL